MNNTDKIRQSAEQAKDIIEKAIEWGKYPHEVDIYCNNALDELDRILTLLPCETCKGIGYLRTFRRDRWKNEYEIRKSCPDCKGDLE